MRRTSMPTTSRSARRSAKSAPTGSSRRGSTSGSPSSGRGGRTAATIPIGSSMSVFKDGVPGNTHFLNLLPDGAAAPPVERIPLYEVYMRMAEELAKRSTCARLQVGTRSEEHTSELQSRLHLVCRLLLEKKKKYPTTDT